MPFPACLKFMAFKCFFLKLIVLFQNKTGTSKVALYPRIKKRKVFKIVKGGSLGFLKVQFVAKYQKKVEGGPFGDYKKLSKKTKNENFEKVS